MVVIHGHTHQLLTNRIGNIHFHGMLSTAWPWPYAPQGMPELTIQMSRPDPFDPNDGCGDGEVRVHADGLVDKVYSLWNRNPITVSRAYTASWGKRERSAEAQPSGPIEHRTRRPNMTNTYRPMPRRRAAGRRAPALCWLCICWPGVRSKARRRRQGLDRVLRRLPIAPQPSTTAVRRADGPKPP